MLINLTELLSNVGYTKDYSINITDDIIESALGSYDIINKEPLKLTIANIGKNKLSLIGTVDLSLNIPCNRCLYDVKTDIVFSFEKAINMSNDSDGVKESEEQDYIDGYNLDVDNLVFCEILIHMPTKTLCKPECKGLCLKCGNNLNLKECGCDRQVLDPRMSVIQDIFNSYKEV